MKMRFSLDKPITQSSEDQLGFYDFVQLIQTSIYCSETPFVYGVLGDWGSGKTSILSLLQSSLDDNFRRGEYPFIPIWFNAWQYENEASIIYPLLYAIKKDYDDRVGAFDEVEGFGSHFLQVVATSTLALADLGFRIGTKRLAGESLSLQDIASHLKTIKEHPDALQSVLGGWADEVTKLHSVFEELLEIYAEKIIKAGKCTRFAKQDFRFVILIDDLDRCLPEITISILESIKNHLAVPKCVFVLGLNPRVIYQGIRLKYGGLDIDGREYLEKILNYSFYVPEPALEKVASFANRQLTDLILDDEKQEGYRGLFEEFGLVLQECHFNNPRKIKRILNRYLLFISEHERTHFNNHGLVRLIVIAEYYPDIFQLFLREHYRGGRDLLQRLASIHSDQFDVQRFEEQLGVSISGRYLQLSQRKGLFDFTNLGSDTFALARDVFAITRVS